MSMINIQDQGDKQVNMHFQFISMKMKNNIWQQPVIIPFSKEYRNDEPSLSYDGNKLFFVSNRPPVDKTEPQKLPDIWIVERRGEGWGYPVNIGPPVNSEGVEVQPFYSRDNKLYFRRRDGLYYSEFKDGKYLSSLKMDEKILKPNLSFICISPDNKTLIGHSFNPNNHGSSDLYASFHNKNGNRGPPISFGNKINTDQNESYATFSPDGKYIFFTRGNDIYWVSAKIIEELRPKE